MASSGEPSKSTISVHLPDGVNDLEIINDTLVITYRLSSGQNVIAYESDVPMVENLANALTNYSGIKSIEIVANETHAIVNEN